MENKTDLIKNNNSNIDLFASNCISKRLKREFINMYNLYDEVIVELSQKPNILNVVVYEYIDKKRVCYKFDINMNYPFHSPVVFLNNTPYITFLLHKTKYEEKYLKKLNGVDCLCCSSITCHYNWYPKNTLNDVIKEIKYYKKVKKDLVLKILLDKIKLQYLIDDIELEGWLF